MAKKTFDELISQASSPVFVDFYADWCGPCRSIAPTVKKLAEEFSGRLTVVKINVDKQPDVAARFQVQGIPALLLFSGGSVVWRSSGALPYQALKTEITRALGW
ncbi:thioredoxin [Prosthecochloris sp. N3]|uniref:Thioredoxin n=1 Tax=Prosthecochloris ethylica TaxID=2743976 RepID=A0ABR9XSK2_9CHLB|nr:thioredoxin [Prosthecochloris ethylica]MBF0586667.1 thioredoxin [Prosthecochloris ethylica]MBF0636979.1 thioredoxin [Prosthecochloris ethylica]NUK47850.1 thioredoxin [Prosthecochloris ethylica]